MRVYRNWFSHRHATARGAALKCGCCTRAVDIIAARVSVHMFNIIYQLLGEQERGRRPRLRAYLQDSSATLNLLRGPSNDLRYTQGPEKRYIGVMV